MFDVKSHAPAELSSEEIARCLTLITEGGAVDAVSVKEQLSLARVIAVIRSGGEIVGVGAIKQRRPRYASEVARRSGFTFDRNMLELGYIARDPSHRGHSLSENIVSELLSAVPDMPLFATTSNEKMKATLKNAGFVKRGKEWLGKDKKPLSLWLGMSKMPRSRK